MGGRDGMKKLVFANVLRGIAALAVVVGHYTGGFWAARETVGNLISAPVLAEDFLTPALFASLNSSHMQWGPFGVGLFFLISGFVIPFSFQKYSPVGFLLGRVIRIYPVYIAGFAVTIASIIFTRYYFYGVADLPFSAGHLAAHFIPGMRDLLQYPSIDGIIWTLEVELRFYVLCALLYPLLRNGSLVVLTVPFAMAAVIPLLGRDIPGILAHTQYMYSLAMTAKMIGIYILFMFIGTAFNLHFRGKLSGLAMAVFAIGLFALFCVSFAFGPQKEILTPTAVSYAAALIVFAGSYATKNQWPDSRIASFFADISYPLYVVHGLAGFVIMRIAIDSGWGALPAVVFAAAASVCAAYLLHACVETPTQKGGRRLGIAAGRRQTDRLPAAAE